MGKGLPLAEWPGGYAADLASALGEGKKDIRAGCPRQQPHLARTPFGNSLNNTITGNSANNSLSSAGGADTLRGGLGNDTVNGGSGNDIFRFGRGEGQDLVQDNSGTADKEKKRGTGYLIPSLAGPSAWAKR